MSAKKGAKSSGSRATPSKQIRAFRKARRQLIVYVIGVGLLGIGIPTLLTGTRHRLVSATPLNEKGLRVSGEGRSDATRVLPAALFSDTRVRNAYRLAGEMPETLNQLYCWCGCIERGMRSNLECFETDHAAHCDVCMAGAEIAAEMRQRGITDPARIQQVLDARFGRKT